MSDLLKSFLTAGSAKNETLEPTSTLFIDAMKKQERENPFQKMIDSSTNTTVNSSDSTLNQFYKLYQNRLHYFRPRIRQEGLKVFPSKSNFYNKILDIQPTLLSQSITPERDISSIDPEAFCWAIGTIYTEMKYKPDILHQVSQDLYGLPETPNNYVYKEGSDDSETENKEILFEDESGRIILKFDHLNVEKEILVTGVVVGILGYVDSNNDLQVIDYCFPPKLAPASLSSSSYSSADMVPQSNSKVLLLSGLELSQETDIEKMSILQSYLSGAISETHTNNLVILGNSLLSYNNLTLFNEFLSTAIRSMTVTLIPSLNDPSDRLVPQRPMNIKLFDRLLQLNSNKLFSLQTNPTYWNAFKVFLEAGDSLNDVVKYSDFDNKEDRTKIMQNFVKWQNLAPTAPDTLNTQPFDINEVADPFVIKDEYPRAMIFGNQPCFISTSYEGVRLLGVPKFSATSQLVELDLKTFEHRLVQL